MPENREQADRVLPCVEHGPQPHRYRPSREAGPFWRCSVCGERCSNIDARLFEAGREYGESTRDALLLALVRVVDDLVLYHPHADVLPPAQAIIEANKDRVTAILASVRDGELRDGGNPMSEHVIVTATIDLDHVERQLLEAVAHEGFGPVASNGLLAVRGLREKLAAVEEAIPKLVAYLRLVQSQCEEMAAGDYGRGAARYVRWVADDIEHFTPDELAARTATTLQERMPDG